MKRSRWIVLLPLLAALLMPAAGCSTNPATGRRQFNVLSTEREINLGSEAAPEFTTEYGGPIPSAQIREYVSNLGKRLAALSERPDLPWEFTVVDSQVINAFALPGGKVFMSRGLLAKFDNTAQLAGVLGHEIGHVTAQHIGQQMSQALVIQGLGLGLGIAGAASDNDLLKVMGVGAGVGGTVYMLKYGRDQESQADELGLRYMTKAGYNPVGQLQVMEILKAEAGRGGTPEFLSTHPLPQTRIDRLNRIIREQYPGYEDPKGKYRFDFEEFDKNVKQPLRSLPPPRHTGQ
jgi:predicted Zn-dependent protease